MLDIGGTTANIANVPSEISDDRLDGELQRHGDAMCHALVKEKLADWLQSDGQKCNEQRAHS